jgi:glutathione synthase
MKKHLFIADHFREWSIENHTTPLIIKELLHRSEQVYTTTPESLFLISETLKSECTGIELREKKLEFNSPVVMNADSFDVIHIRTDPPFNMKYYYQLLFLNPLEKKIRFINSPEGILKYNEKLSILRFPELITDTIVTSRFEIAEEFLIKHKTIVLKSLSECSSRGILKIDHSNKERLSDYLKTSAEPVMFQKYIEEVTKGEVRVTIINGEPVGWMKKVPEQGSFLASLDFGASMVEYIPDEEDISLAKKVGSHLLEQGIYFSALDIINKNLSEVNVTSPGLIKEMNSFCPIPLEKIYCDMIFAD